MPIVFLAIVFLSFGVLGGSLQPTRILLLVLPIFFAIYKDRPFSGYSNLVKFGFYCYFIWISYGIISLLWSPLQMEGLSSEIIVMMVGMSSLLTFPFIANNEERAVKMIRNAWIVGLMVTIPIALYEIATLNHFAAADEDRILGGVGINAPFAAVFFGNYNNYCVYISLCFPMLLWAFLEDKNIFRKISYIVLIILSVFIVVINTSRTGMVILAIYLLSLLRFNFKSLAIAGSSIIVLLLMYRFLPSNIKDTIELLFTYRVNVSYSEDASSQIRNDVYKAGFQFVEDTYGIGVGAGGFEDYMLRSPLYKGISNPHNMFIEIVSQYGILVFSIFVVWLGKIILTIYRNINFTSDVKRVLYLSIILIPVIGLMNSSALGYTYWWVYISSLVIIADRKIVSADA